MATNRTKDDLPAEGARENVNLPEDEGRDERTGERGRGPAGTTAEERDRESQPPRQPGRRNQRRTTL